MEIREIQIPNKGDVVKVAAIAKTSYHSESYSYFENMKYKDATKFLKALIKQGHYSVLEPLQFIFNLEGVSRILTHQLVRNRIGFSYMQKSLRRKRSFNKKDSFIYPESVNKKIYEDTVENLFKIYDHLIEIGEHPDDARRVIPIGVSTEITFTCNARSLRTFLEARLSKQANWEIRNLAVNK